MGTLFMVNPPRKRRRTAAQRRATAKMIAANKRRRRGVKRKKVRRRRNPTAAQRRARYARSLTVGHGGKKRRRRASTTTRRKRTRTMAAKRRRTTAKRRRRASPKRRRSGVQTLRRHSVYLTNPRRRRRVARHRRRHSRNPALFATLKQGAMDAGATLVGGAAARTVSGMLPANMKDGITGVATGMAVAVGVGFVARKVVSADRARFIVAGAMQVPIKSLITTFVPGAGAFLGDYDNVGAYALPAGVGDYLNPGGGMYASPQDVEIGAYE